MARPAASKQRMDRIDIRTEAETKRTLQRAADLKGTDLSKFMISLAFTHAKQILDEHEKTTLTDLDRKLFFAALENPKGPNEALKKAATRYKQLFK